MCNKKKLLLNCDVCDTRKMKEEDYSGYEKIIINADVVVVNAYSKGVLNRLPVMINQDCTIEIADDIEVELKTVNGSYEITGNTAVQEHTLLVVNGALNIHSGTENTLEKYEKIYVNGSVKYPESLEAYLTKLSVNGSVLVYPDKCVILDNTFIMDKYFTMRAKEGMKYYVESKVIIQDKMVALEKLVQKKVQFITRQIIVPEELAESCVELFDEKAEFVVIPAGMTFHYGDADLNEELLKKEGSNIYVYGDLNVSDDIELEGLSDLITRLIVRGNVALKKTQEKCFRKLNVEYSQLEFKWEGRIIENKPGIRVDKSLLDGSPAKLLVRNAATIKIASDVTPELILERLMIENCAKVFCREEQESAIAAITQNVAKIGESGEDESSGMMEGIKDLRSTNMITADSYIM
ncbi:MAG: hypothetical protein J6J42_10940 [Lachnospiraceae bacterium]|nr:hypothetical protein [Lachnospiraceae bacterium]